jgi:chaperonin GroES
MEMLNDNLLVRRIANATNTKGGLYVPQNADSPFFKYKVLSVGPGKKNKKGNRIPMAVNPGDTVVAAKFNGNDIMVDGVTYYILNSSQVLCVVDEE